MATNKKIRKNFLLSATPSCLSFIEYQVVYQYVNQDKYIKSFNIIKEGRIIKKFYLDKKLHFEETTDVASIVQEMLLNQIIGKSNNSSSGSQSKKNTSTQNKETNAQARKEAASKLIMDLGLK